MSQTDALPKAKLRILIADDIQETRRSVRLMLSMNPDVIVIAIATDGVQAVELAKEHHPDIVVLDINMPRADGLAAFKEISRIYPDTGCIIMSAQKETTTLSTAMSLGAQEYLLKPFMIDELNDAVNRVAAQVMESRRKLAEAEQLRKKSDAYLQQLADEYAKSRRTDDQALGVFEQLAENPNCELRWLRTLAMLYIIRQEWGKLKTLASRLEQQSRSSAK